MTFEQLQEKYPIGANVQLRFPYEDSMERYPQGDAIVKDHVMEIQDWNSGNYDMDHITYIASEIDYGGQVGCYDEVKGLGIHIWSDVAGQDLIVPWNFIKPEGEE